MQLTIVVPLPAPHLDPDRAGEWALPYARSLAARRAAPTVLVSVVEPPVDVGVRTPGGDLPADHAQRRQLRTMRQAYLAQIGDRFPGTIVRPEVRFANVVAEVLAKPTVTNLAVLQTGEEILIRELLKPGKFALGQMVMTPGADQAMRTAGHIPHEFLLRHKHVG